MNVGAVSRRFGAAVLVIGPLSLVAGSLFQVASDDDSVSSSLAKIAAHPSGERAVIICNLLAAAMLPAMLYLMRLAGPRAPRLTLAGGAVSFAAWMAGLYSLGASNLLYDHAAQSPDRSSAVSLVHAVTGDAESYQYLVESIRKFPKPSAFAEMIRAAGFSRVTWQSLSGGVVALHSGWRL